MLGAKTRVGLLGTFVAFLGIMGAAFAGSLATPKERPILTISGKIGVTNKDGTAQFDRAMLEALGLVAIETDALV